MRPIVFIILFIALSYTSTGQFFEKNYGLRFGNTTGFSIKAIKDGNRAFEGIVGFRNNGLQIYGLLESYKQVMTRNTDGFRIYFGPGVHLGFVTYREYDCCNSYYRPRGPIRFLPVIGFNGIIGFEYNFPMAPIVIGVDYKPFFELENFYRFRLNLWDFGFTIKYAIY
jgi:hypothetical protein